MDDTAPDRSGADPHREKQNALACAKRHDTFGYVGPMNSEAAFSSEPVLNRAGMVQISPSTTHPALTSPAVRELLQPATYRRRLRYVTFYRVITTDLLQGPSGVAFLKERLHARSYFLVDDALTYGQGLAGTARKYAARIGLRLVGVGHLVPRSPATTESSAAAVADIVVATRPDAVYAGADAGAGGALAAALRVRGYAGALMGGDAFRSNPAFVHGGTTVARVYATDTEFDASAIPRSFRRAYQGNFHVALQVYDAGAYDAANMELNAIYQAATRGALRGDRLQMRASILPYVAGVHWHGVTGTTSFDRNGDTRNLVISMYAVRDGMWRFVGKAPTVKGVGPTG
jgi:branched-chain amino acid transport system substrate-binding protein